MDSVKDIKYLREKEDHKRADILSEGLKQYKDTLRKNKENY